MFKINEAADMLHVNPNALRFYEKKGIIAPHRDENNYRMYTICLLYTSDAADD